jgi:hypothetical protein
VTRDLIALCYLDATLFLNRVRVVVREPKRLLPWLFFVLWLGWALPARMFYARGHVTGGAELETILPVLVPGGMVAIIGFVVVASRPPAAFASPADARFLCGSALAPRLVVLWLLLRQVRRQLLLWGANVVFWIAVLPFAFQVGVGDAVIAALALALAGSLVLGMQLPLFVAARRWRPGAMRALGVVLVVAGVAAVGGGALELGGETLPEPWAALVTGLPPGGWLVGAATGRALPMAALALSASAAIVASVALAGDCYPELWQSSLRVFTVRRVLRRGGLRSRAELRRALQDAGVNDARRRTQAVSAGASWVPAGAWTLLWKEWVALGRGRLGYRLAGAIVLAALVGGAGLALLAGAGVTGTRRASTIAGLAAVLVFAIALGGAIRLSSDLRSPLWWLSASGLRARLGVWTFAGALKAAVPVAAACLGAAVVDHSWLWLGLAPVALAASWLLRATGLVVYSLVPASFDLAGPGRLLRGLAFYVLLIPLIVLVTVVAFVSRSLVAGAVTLLLIATLEGLALVYVAAWRIEGNGVAFALAERR